MTPIFKTLTLATLGLTAALAMSDAEAKATSDSLEAQEKESLAIIKSKQKPSQTPVASAPQASKPVPAWYLNFGLGASQIEFDATTQASIDAATGGTVRNFGMAIDMGIYVTLGRFLAGYAIMGNGAAYPDSEHYTLATGGLSAIVFPFSAAHQGLYARVDVGASALNHRVNGVAENNATGVGALVGLGVRMGVWNIALNAMATEIDNVGTNYAYNTMLSVMW